jgi:hypothetical protein
MNCGQLDLAFNVRLLIALGTGRGDLPQDFGLYEGRQTGFAVQWESLNADSVGIETGFARRRAVYALTSIFRVEYILRPWNLSSKSLLSRTAARF